MAGTDADGMVAGDVAMLEHEVTPVLTGLRANGLNIVAIHHHMTDVKPVVIEHMLAHVSQRRRNGASYVGVGKNTFDLRRASAIQNLEMLHRSETESRKAA